MRTWISSITQLQQQDASFDVAGFAAWPQRNGAEGFQINFLGEFRGVKLKHSESYLFFGKFCLQVRDHNAGSSKAGQLVGSKAQAVKNILNCVPRQVLKLIVDYTVEVEWEGTPWSDDCMGSKKWLTGFQCLNSKNTFFFAQGALGYLVFL